MFTRAGQVQLRNLHLQSHTSVTAISLACLHSFAWQRYGSKGTCITTLELLQYIVSGPMTQNSDCQHVNQVQTVNHVQSQCLLAAILQRNDAALSSEFEELTS